MSFDAKEFLPAAVSGESHRREGHRPRALSARGARSAKRRESLTKDGRLNILAADHPARRVTRVGDDPLRMADRHEYMARILRVLMSDGVDGLLATMDIIEDLLIIDDLMRESRAARLPRRQGAHRQLQPRRPARQQSGRSTTRTPARPPQSCKEWGIDGAKILLRLCDDEPDSLKTLLDDRARPSRS